ncbi:MAG: NAD(P)-binding domain-containing protein, partial [Alphaproteobacteria bacterium]
MAAAKRKVGYIGVGLMGHGAARNILEKGHALAVLGNRHPHAREIRHMA